MKKKLVIRPKKVENVCIVKLYEGLGDVKFVAVKNIISLSSTIRFIFE